MEEGRQKAEGGRRKAENSYQWSVIWVWSLGVRNAEQKISIPPVANLEGLMR